MADDKEQPRHLETPAPDLRAPDCFINMLRVRHPDLTDAEIYEIFLSH